MEQAVLAEPAPAAPAGGRSGLARLPRVGLEHGALLGILALSAVLNLHRLSQNGYANAFYSAAAKSMLRSWHNFFFVSFDAGGLVAVDKPPLGLWLQAASAKLFGFGPLSLLVPEAIVGTLCVLVLYRVVSRRFGALAGLASALALAVFPSFVAISRDNGPDALLILLMILACGSALRACESGRMRSLLLAAVWVGLAFNTKQLAAFLVVPGIGLAFLICAPVSALRRVLMLAGAGIALAVVSLSWSLVVQATPASQRPYVGGSNNNSEFALAFSYNGVGRVGGQSGGPGQLPASELLKPKKRKRKHKPLRLATQRPQHNSVPVVFGGPTGPLRLVRNNLGAQGGWQLPLAVLALVAIALTVRGRRDPRLAGLLVLGGWFAVEAVILSFSSGIVHPYYVSALGPGLAAVVGAGTLAFGELIRRRRLFLLLFALAVGGTIAVQVAMLHRDRYLGAFVPALILLCVVGLLAGLVRRRLAIAGAVVAFAALSFAPLVYSWTLWEVPTEGTFPAAGPHAAGGPGGVDLSAGSERVVNALLRYVNTHGATRRWPLLTQAATTAAPMVLLGTNAGSLAGYGATDPALDAQGLARLVQRGEARYVLLGGAYADRGGTAASRAVPYACPLIFTHTWRGRVVPIGRYSFHLYDCAASASLLQFTHR